MTVDDILKQIEIEKEIPVTHVSQLERDKLVDMDQTLAQDVIGQKQAIASVSNAVRRARAGLNRENKPWGSFLFLGPTGVGKTELARALAKFLFGRHNALIRLDMSEYMEKSSLSTLLGSAPGLVGSELEGTLTGPVRKNPFSVLLLDEIEKAHPEILNILLQGMDNGEMKDSKGRPVDFRNLIVIMTGNIGALQARKEEIGLRTATTTTTVEKRQSSIVDKLLPPEFRNRFDEIIYFKTLTRDEIYEIVGKEERQLNEVLATQNLRITFTESAKLWLMNNGFSQEFGARDLRRTIQKNIEDPLALKIISGEIKSGDHLIVEAESTAIHVGVAAPVR